MEKRRKIDEGRGSEGDLVSIKKDSYSLNV